MPYKLTNNPLENSALFTAEQAAEIKEKEPKNKKGRPAKDDIIKTGAQAGLTADYTRATFIVKLSVLDQIKDYAYTERLSMKDAVNKLLIDSLEAYKAQGGVLLKRKGGVSDD